MERLGCLKEGTPHPQQPRETCDGCKRGSSPDLRSQKPRRQVAAAWAATRLPKFSRTPMSESQCTDTCQKGDMPTGTQSMSPGPAPPALQPGAGVVSWPPLGHQVPSSHVTGSGFWRQTEGELCPFLPPAPCCASPGYAAQGSRTTGPQAARRLCCWGHLRRWRVRELRGARDQQPLVSLGQAPGTLQISAPNSCSLRRQTRSFNASATDRKLMNYTKVFL